MIRFCFIQTGILSFLVADLEKQNTLTLIATIGSSAASTDVEVEPSFLFVYFKSSASFS